MGVNGGNQSIMTPLISILIYWQMYIDEPSHTSSFSVMKPTLLKTITKNYSNMTRESV